MTITNQILPNSTAPYVQQQNFGQMIGEVNSYHSSAGAPVVQNIINNVVRDLYDLRRWYGTMTKGQIVTTGLYNTGTVSVTYGSASVQGTNTNWTPSLNGVPITQQSFRLGFTAPIYNIIALDQANQVITLELPWGNPAQSSSGYYIAQYYYSFPNIKSFFSIRNLALMYRLVTGLNQSFIDNYDPSRLVMLYSRLLAAMPPDASGNYQAELWPVNTTQQAFPYTAWIQPPNLVNDTDNLPPYIRADVVKAKAIANLLLYRPKSNTYYSEAVAVGIAREKMLEYQSGVQSMWNADEALWLQDVTRRGEEFPYIDPVSGAIPGGGMARAMQAYGVGDGGDGEYGY